MKISAGDRFIALSGVPCFLGSLSAYQAEILRKCKKDHLVRISRGKHVTLTPLGETWLIKSNGALAGLYASLHSKEPG